MLMGFFVSPIGVIEIQVTKAQVSSLTFVDDRQSEVMDSKHADDHEVMNLVLLQLAEYFDGKRKQFDLPLCIQGTDFQRRTLQEVLKVPYGETMSYHQVANAMGHPRASRAIGNANRLNTILIIIPCHRVIGKNNKLTGYAAGLWRKNWLIEHEKGEK